MIGESQHHILLSYPAFRSGSGYYLREYITIYHMQNKLAHYCRIAIDKGKTLSFQEFLEYCVIAQYNHGGNEVMDVHWRPQHSRGSLCDISYSFLGK